MDSITIFTEGPNGSRDPLELTKKTSFNSLALKFENGD